MSSLAGSRNSSTYTSLILGFHNESLMMLLLLLGDDAKWNWADLKYGAFCEILAE